MSDYTKFADDLIKLLNNYTVGVAEDVKELAETTMKEFVAETKADAPKRSGDYKKAISSKTLAETKFSKSKIWYVKGPHYRLSHLLENGHAKRGGGRVKAYPHIRKNAEMAINKFEKEVEEKITNANK